MASAIRILEVIESISFFAILIFTPLAFGATPKWAFFISVWMGTLAFSALLVKRLWLNQTLLPRTALAYPLAFLVVLTLASLSTSIYRTATLWAMVRLILYAGAFYLALDMMASRKQTKRLILLIFCTGASLAFLGFVKYAGAPFPTFWITSGNGLERELTATFLNHNHLAGYLEMVFPLGLGLLLFNRTLLHPLLWSFLLILILAALFFSMSRGGWIAVLIASGLMFVTFAVKKGLRLKRLTMVLAAVLLVAGISFLGSNAMIERLQTLQNPDEPNLAAIRLPVWAASVQLIHQNPWLGKGLGTFPWSFTAVRPAGLGWRFREAHNDYLQIATDLGLPALIPIVWGLYLIFSIGFQALQQRAGQFRAGVTLGALGGIAAILVHSLIDFNIQITSNGILFSVLVGMIAAQESRQVSVSTVQEENGSHWK
jgi:O-antigen ligase